jgi:hypothetical protein
VICRSSTAQVRPNIDTEPSINSEMRSTRPFGIVAPKPICSRYSGPNPFWIAIHHGPAPSPARSVTATGPLPCFWIASAGENAGFGGVGPVSRITPCAMPLLPPPRWRRPRSRRTGSAAAALERIRSRRVDFSEGVQCDRFEA